MIYTNRYRLKYRGKTINDELFCNWTVNGKQIYQLNWIILFLNYNISLIEEPY